MTKRSKRDDDFATNALRVVEESIGGKLANPGERPKSQRAVEAGRRGGLKGGKARANKLTTSQRREIARKAAKKRWD
jgi:hypothetical protein